MRQNLAKTYLLVPLLSIVTLFMLPLKMYWSTQLCCDMLYDIVDDITKATHVKIVGRPGNIDICKLENLTEKVRPILQRFQVRESKLYLTTNPFFVSLDTLKFVVFPIPLH
jgi:hypothetical protein